jgi:hypothetical protein
MIHLKSVSFIQQDHLALTFQAIFHPGNFIFSPAMIQGLKPNSALWRVNQEGEV